MATPPPGLPSTLGDIILKVRRLTKSPNINQITDDQITQYVNTFYIYDFPEHLRLKDLFTNYTFYTIPNQDTYALPTDFYVSVEGPLYINGYQSFFSQDQDQFYQLYPKLGLQETIGFGDGTPGPFTYTFANTPILQNELSIGTLNTNSEALQANDQSVDTYTGNLVGDVAVAPAVNTVSYVPGTITVTFNQNTLPGQPITAFYVPYVPSRPVAALFYHNNFILRPVPDNSYLVRIACYQTPTILTAIDSPEIKQWWQLLAFGAAMKIFEDRGDIEEMARYRPLFEEQMNLAVRRTVKQQASQRSATIYTEQTNNAGFGSNWFNQF